jgi:hypothetical protein
MSNKKLSTQEFIRRSNIIHNNKFDYSKSIYINQKTNLTVTCPVHGDILVRPDRHLSGNECFKCANRYMSNTEEFIKKSKLKHGNKFDYSKSNYIGSSNPITIICPTHGEFTILAQSHLKGFGCIKCVNDNQTKATDQFITESKSKFKDKFDYNLVNYKNSKTKISLKCNKHNYVFDIRPDSHLSGSGGCKICKSSTGELKISNYLQDNNISFIAQNTFDDLNYKTTAYSFDFYLPDFNLLIEYDGIQHFEPVKFFGGVKTLNRIQKCDNIKNEYARKKGIKLLRIPHVEFNNIELILNSVLN